MLKTTVGPPTSMYWYFDFLLQGTPVTLGEMDLSEKTLINQVVYYTKQNLIDISEVLLPRQRTLPFLFKPQYRV